jgi:hypothetical protein
LVETAIVRGRLSDLQRFLEAHGVKYAPQVAEVRQRIDRIRTTALPQSERDRVRALFGGMGSLNDVVISRANGHVVDDEAAANQEVDRLTRELWESIDST